MGNPFYVLQPALGDLLKELPRNTQILYPKDIGFILVQMGIGEGQVVLEAGTGSGSLTSAMAFAVGSRGKVITYEAREEMQKLARKNISRLGLEERVDFKLRELTQEQGFNEEGVDALFLDLPNPYDYIHHARKALKMGGFFGCILPTANQVSKLLLALRQFDFAFVDVCEVLLRYYKPEPDRLRPVDRMVAHTGFLIFARPVLIENGDEQINELEETDELENDIED
ncbi:MAG: tRNA (adenine-N1)-methyltransferase [Chloroflexota bacterium]